MAKVLTLEDDSVQQFSVTLILKNIRQKPRNSQNIGMPHLRPRSVFIRIKNQF